MVSLTGNKHLILIEGSFWSKISFHTKFYQNWAQKRCVCLTRFYFSAYYRAAIVPPTRNTLDLRLFHSFAVFFGHGDEPLRFRFDDGVFLRLFLEFLFYLLRLLEAFARRFKVKLVGELDQRVRHADVQNAAPAKIMLSLLSNVSLPPVFMICKVNLGNCKALQFTKVTSTECFEVKIGSLK